MPNSRFAPSRFSPSLIHGLCAFFASNSRFMRLFQAGLDTCLDSPFSATLSVHGLHFTVYAPSNLPPLPGGHFGPPKKISSPLPPQKIPQFAQAPSRPLGPSRPGEPPLEFSIKNRPPPPRLGLPLPPPRAEKNFKKPKRPPGLWTKKIHY